MRRTRKTTRTRMRRTRKTTRRMYVLQRDKRAVKRSSARQRTSCLLFARSRCCAMFCVLESRSPHAARSRPPNAHCLLISFYLQEEKPYPELFVLVSAHRSCGFPIPLDKGLSTSSRLSPSSPANDELSPGRCRLGGWRAARHAHPRRD